MHIINYVCGEGVICSLNLSVGSATHSSRYLRSNSESCVLKTEKELALFLYQTHWTAGQVLFPFPRYLHVLSTDLLKTWDRVKPHVFRQGPKEGTTWMHCTRRRPTVKSWFGILVSSQHHLCPTTGTRLYLPFAGYRPFSPCRVVWGGWANTPSGAAFPARPVVQAAQTGHGGRLPCLWGNSPPEETQVCNSPAQRGSQHLAQSRHLRYTIVFKVNFCWLTEEY